MELLETLYNKPNNVTKTRDYWITVNGEERIDSLLGSTAFIFGYSNEHILQKMQEVQRSVAFIKDCTTEQSSYNTALIEKICTAGNFEGLAWAVSGSDGVEVALYTNENYWHHKGISKQKVLTFDPNYHGATYLPRKLRSNYANTVLVSGPGWNDVDKRTQAELDCLARVREELSKDSDIGAVLMEGCPWTERLRPWSRTWWEGIRKLCDEFDINLIVDDVFAGYGKTGDLFTHLIFDVQPDIVALGKSITGGYSPLSCACATKKITAYASKDWDFSHTWTPNMAGIGAGLAVLELFDKNDIMYIEHRLNMIAESLSEAGLIKQVTSQGLLMQMDLTKDYDRHVLEKHGISGTLKGGESIILCAPVIADDEYFEELESRLMKALSDV